MANRHFTFLGLPNFVKRGLFTITSLASNTTYDAAGMPPSNLANEEPSVSESARITQIDPRWAGWQFYCYRGATAGNAGTAIALINTTLSPWGLWRVYDGNYIVGLNNAAPTRIVVGAHTVNVSGAINDVNYAGFGSERGISPGSDAAGNLFTGSSSSVLYDWNGANWSGAYGMSGFPLTGPNMANFAVRMWMDMTAYTNNDSNAIRPYVECQLFDNGVLKRSLGWRGLTQESQVLIFPFNPAELSAWSNIGVKFVVHATASKVGVDEIAVYFDTVTGTADFDSGYLPSPIANLAVDIDTPSPSNDLFYMLPSGSYMMPTGKDLPIIRVRLLDDQTTHDPAGLHASGQVYLNSITLRPLGYTQAGVAVIGDAITLTYGTTKNKPFILRVVSTQQGGQTKTGQSYAADAFRQRAADFELKVTQAELNVLLDAIDYRRGYSGAFFVAADPDAPATSQRFNRGWGTLSPGQGGEATPIDSSYDEDGVTPVYTKTLNFVEKL